MNFYGLQHSYSKFSGKKLKEQLSSFLPNLPGIIDRPGHLDNRCINIYFLSIIFIIIFKISYIYLNLLQLSILVH